MVHNGVDAGIVRYVDDFLVIAPTHAKCEQALKIMLDTCHDAGFPVQPTKVTAPANQVKFLGVYMDTVSKTLSIDVERLSEIKDLTAQALTLTHLTKRQLLSLVGKLSFAARVVHTGRAFLGRLIHLAKSAPHLHYKIRLTQEAKGDITWWHDCVEAHNGVSMFQAPWDELTTLHVFTDASDTAFGCYFHPEWVSLTYSSSIAHARQMSINWRELHAAVIALSTWSGRLTASNVIFHIDNQSVVGALQKHYSPVVSFMTLIRHWCHIISTNSINAFPVYISTHENIDADDLSRLRISQFLARHPDASPHPIWPEFLNFP